MKDAEARWRYALMTREAPLSAETNLVRILAAFETNMSFTGTQCPEICPSSLFHIFVTHKLGETPGYWHLLVLAPPSIQACFFPRD